MKLRLPLVAGKEYEMRNGKKGTVLKVDDGELHPVLMYDNSSRTFWGDIHPGREHPMDIISPWEEKSTMELKLPLVVGKEYQLRNDTKDSVESIDMSDDSNCATVYLVTMKSGRHVRLDGQFGQGGETQFDIIGPWAEEEALTPEDIMRDYTVEGIHIEDLKQRGQPSHPRGYANYTPVEIMIDQLKYHTLDDVLKWRPLTPKDKRPRVKDGDWVILFDNGKILHFGEVNEAYKDGLNFEDEKWVGSEDFKKILRVNPDETTTEVRL